MSILRRRPSLTWKMPFRPLAELRQPSVGAMCVLCAMNHGLIYSTCIIVPLVAALYTQDPIYIGLLMLPMTCGTVFGSIFFSKFAPLLGKVGRRRCAELPMSVCAAAPARFRRRG